LRLKATRNFERAAKISLDLAQQQCKPAMPMPLRSLLARSMATDSARLGQSSGDGRRRQHSEAIEPGRFADGPVQQ
jgi:hypothetical protein